MNQDTRSGQAHEARPTLSICIPSYNRAECLPDLLGSIASEIARLPEGLSGEDVEIVVSDNASQDETEAVVESYRPVIPRLVYLRQRENIGADRNYLAAIAGSSGTFSWLMGSDDRIEAGGLLRVLQAAERFGDLAGFTVGVKGYDRQFADEIRITHSTEIPDNTIISGPENIFATFIERFGLISAQIVRRELWQAVCEEEDLEPYFNAYVHLFVIGKMIQRNPGWGYVARDCVGWRSGNDSFLKDGWLQRMTLDVVGYDQCTAGAFGQDAQVRRVVRDRVARSHVYRHYFHAKTHDASRESLREGARLIRRHFRGTSAYRTILLPLILVPTSWLRLARQVYRRLRGQEARASMSGRGARVACPADTRYRP